MKRNLRELTMRNRTAPLTLLMALTLCLSIFPFKVNAFSLPGGDDSDSDGDSSGSSRVRFENSSENVKNCEKLLGNSWGTYAQQMKEKGFMGSGAALDAVKSNIPQIILEHSKMKTIVEGGKIKQGNLQDVHYNTIAAVFHQLALCEAYARTLDPENYGDGENSDEFEERESKPSMGAHGLPCLNQPTGASQQQCLMQAQMQEPLKCVNKKNETHDYLACKRILNFIDGFAIGKQVMQMQQGYRAGAHQLDLQQDYMKKVNTGEAGVTDAMAVQRDSLEKQANLAYEMAAFDAAKAATLLTMLDRAPRPGSYISEHCQDKTDMSSLKGQSFDELLSETLGSNKVFAEELQDTTKGKIKAKLSEVGFPYEGEICDVAIGTSRSSNNIFMSSNQKVFDQVKGLAIKAGLEALANGAKGAILNKQADMIDDAMKDVQEFEPPEFPVAEALEATASECLVDPNAEGCLAPNGTGFDGFRDQGFSATVGGSANLGSDLGRGNIDDSDSGVNGASGPDRSLIPNDFGVVQQAGDSDNSFSDGTARAGSIKAGELAAGGGAGGGGAGGGGGGLGGGPARGPANKKAPSGKKDIKIKTSGTGLGVVGGRGRVGARKKSKASNPFSKLLGKSKKGGNGTLNFRGPAQLGGKKGSLFKMISNRYNVVQSKDRLLKYEAER